MDINALKNWEKNLKNEQHKIEQELMHVKALIEIRISELPKNNPITKNVLIQNQHKRIDKTKAKKINKREAIYNSCKNRNDDFTANDIKESFTQSEDEEIRNISIGYISAQLCKFAKDGKIHITKKGKGKGSPNFYTNS